MAAHCRAWSRSSSVRIGAMPRVVDVDSIVNLDGLAAWPCSVR